MFNRSTVQISAWKSNLQREENRSTRLKWDQQISTHVQSLKIDPGSIVEVEGASDDHYANLTPYINTLCDTYEYIH